MCSGTIAGRLLAGEGGLAPLVPAPVEVAVVALDPLGRRLVGRVAGAGGEVEHPRLLDVDVAEVLDELDRAIDEVGGEVVALVVGGGRLHLVVVVEQRRHELVGLAGEEPVVALEAATERPPGTSGAEVLLVLRGEVPLAHRVRRVAVRGEHGGEEGAGLGDACVVAREAGGEVDDAAHAGHVVVAAGEHAGARGRAQRGGVKARVAQTARRECVEARGVDVGAEAAELCEPHVVEDHEQDVRGALRRGWLIRPEGLGLPVVATDLALELAWFHAASMPDAAAVVGGRVGTRRDGRDQTLRPR